MDMHCWSAKQGVLLQWDSSILIKAIYWIRFTFYSFGFRDPNSRMKQGCCLCLLVWACENIKYVTD